jgi:heme/copper-type cytochrome/quinol oxidase subunit 2
VPGREKGGQQMDWDTIFTWMLYLGIPLVIVLIVVFFIVRSRRPED